MSADFSGKERLVATFSPVIPRLLILIFAIAFFSVAGIAGMVVYKEVPVEIWGLKIGRQIEEKQTNDIPFLITEVRQLKEQGKLLEKRLIKLLAERELQKNQLKECRNKALLGAKG